MAKVLRTQLTGKQQLTTLNDESFCIFMRDVCHVPYQITKAMLSRLLPIKLDAFGLYRLSLAIMHYLPQFESRDASLQDLEEDLPNVWAHARIIGTRVVEENRGRFSIYIKVLYMTSMLAGRLQTFCVPYWQVKGIFCAIGLRTRIKQQDNPAPSELTSMYVHLHVGESAGNHVEALAWGATASEKKHNKELMTLRVRKDCSRVGIQCSECPLGKDKCALACRQYTIEVEK